MTTVLLVDDHALFRKGLNALLKYANGFHVIGEAATESEALEATARLLPDLILMDLGLKGMGGIDATKKIHHDFPNVKIIILTAFSDGSLVYDAIQAGASGYLLKSFDPDELFAALNLVMRGDSVFDPSLASNVLSEFMKRNSNDDSSLAAKHNLTVQELNIIRVLSQGYSNQEIGMKMGLSVNTVKVHVSHIMTKLDVRSRVGIVIFAYEKDLVERGAFDSTTRKLS